MDENVWCVHASDFRCFRVERCEYVPFCSPAKLQLP